MHSNIYQISSSPISEDEYASPSRYYDNSGDFADYIGDAYEDDERLERIDNFANIIGDVFDYKGDGVFVYKGADAMRKFKQAWIDELKRQASELTADNMFVNLRLFHLEQLTKKTHVDASSRVDIDSWAGGVAYPLGELYEWANSKLNKGDRIYIGAVIDYHW
jgi:hypothetical protein